MPTLIFKTDQFQLAYYLCLKHFANDAPHSDEWSAVRKGLEERFGATAAHLFFSPELAGWGLNWVGFPETDMKRFVRDRSHVLAIFDRIFDSDIFQKMLAETEAYGVAVSTEWAQMGEQVLAHLRDITGMTVSEDISVLILHPSLDIGSYIGGGEIEWGIAESYRYSNSIGLAHEMLHFATNDLADSLATEAERWKLHALIRLATDEEIRSRLHPESPEYFQDAHIKGYHAHLIETAKSLLPQWRTYLSNPERNLVTLFETVR